MDIRIGPAGLGPVKTALVTLDSYHKKGFRACELAFTYGAYIKDEKDARAIGARARELDIALSIHAPYFINLNSEDLNKRKASRERILACCRVAHWLGAHTVVFHPGYYSKDKEQSYQTIKKEVIGLLREIKRSEWRVEIAPETMGRVNVFGSLDEIARLVRDTGCSFCIDVAHLLARDKVVEHARLKTLFPQKKWHMHFSGIIYGEKGEKSHRTTEKEEWENLLQNLPREKNITIVNESPTMLEDCGEGLALAQSFGLA